MNVSKDKLIWTFKRVRIQFRGNYDLIVKNSFVYAVLIIVFVAGLVEIWETVTGVFG